MLLSRRGYIDDDITNEEIFIVNISENDGVEVVNEEEDIFVINDKEEKVIIIEDDVVKDIVVIDEKDDVGVMLMMKMATLITRAAGNDIIFGFIIFRFLISSLSFVLFFEN